MHISSNKIIKINTLHFLNIALLIILTAMLIVNQVLMGEVKVKMGMNSKGIMEHVASFSILGKLVGSKVKLTGELSKDSATIIMMHGVPEKYGTQLGLSYDKVQESMNVMRQYDPDSGTKAIILTGKKLERYINIGIKISCEYCCSAISIIQSSGASACGCAHAKAMRGLMAYLIQNYDESNFSNDQILRELARWKGRYFPKQMMKKLTGQIQSGKYTHDISAILLDIKLPKYSNSSTSVPLPSSIEDLPSMVGGC